MVESIEELRQLQAEARAFLRARKADGTATTLDGKPATSFTTTSGKVGDPSFTAYNTLTYLLDKMSEGKGGKWISRIGDARDLPPGHTKHEITVQNVLLDKAMAEPAAESAAGKLQARTGGATAVR